MDSRTYLQRIGLGRVSHPDLQNLIALQKAHLYAVPFENLSIHTGENIHLDPAWLYQKIVERRRGGFCYELNGLFCWLLRELGYTVTMLSAKVHSEDGSFGPEFDHLVLRVDLDESWLVDVGFGRAFTEPLAIRVGAEQAQGIDRFRITTEGGEFVYWRFDQDWIPEYRFSTVPRALEDFQGMCRYHQTSPKSPFTKRWLATMLTPHGRETLHQDGGDFRYILSGSSGRQERIIQGWDNAQILLEEIFGISQESLRNPRRKNRKA